jgi:transcriptional regulator with XRE-family HTH domain
MAFKIFFSSNLRFLRQAKGLTLEQLARDFTTTKQTVSRWETGVRLPPLDIVSALASYFDVSLDVFVNNDLHSPIAPTNEEPATAEPADM